MQTILLIENAPAILVARSLILRCFGYTVLEAGSRREAWRVCRQHKGPIHLILMQAGLDDGRSNEFVTRLKLLHPQICALFIVGELSREFSDMPCEYVLLQTPFRADALAFAIRGLLDRTTTLAVSSLS